MSEAVERHHSEMRALIQKTDGYEVKTIGDSFMVAFGDVDKAIHFAVSIQSRFFEFDWNSNGIDDTYIALQEEAIAAAEEQGDSSPHFTPSDTECKLWNGIRIRVGIHFGLGDIKLDEVSRGYDYYGTVVNTAARVEGIGHGGQILISEEVLKNITDTAPYSVLNLGPQQLRGLDEKVVVHQVLPQHLAGRKFPPLCLSTQSSSDEESGSGSDDKGRTNLTTAAFLERAARRGNAQKIPTAQLQRHFDFLSTTISPATREIKFNTIAHLAQRWRVSIPNVDSMDDATKHDLLLAAVATEATFLHRMKQTTSDRDGFMGIERIPTGGRDNERLQAW